MKDENYIHIQGWMVNKLNLSGNDLICYAIIYGFSQDGETKFNGSTGYLAKCMNCSKPTVFKSLKSLIAKNHLIKTDIFNNGVKFCQYSTIFTGGKETLQGVVKNLQGGGKESLHNNTTINNTIDNTIVIEREEKKKTKRFLPPSISEVEDYCFEKRGLVDKIECEKFINFYESKNWMVGKSKMVKWRSAFSSWLIRSDEYKSNKPKEKLSDVEKANIKLQEWMDRNNGGGL